MNTKHWNDDEDYDGGKEFKIPRGDVTVLPPAANKKMEEATTGEFNAFDALMEMRRLLVVDLMERLKSGTATHQELAVMNRLLKDNGIVLMPYPEEPRPTLGPALLNNEGEPLQPIGFHTPLPEFPVEDDEYEFDPLEELGPDGRAK